MLLTLRHALRVTGLVALWGGAAVLVVAIGYFASTRPELSLLAAAGVCLFGLTLMDSAFIPLLMVVPALVTYRIGLGGTDLTVSDAWVDAGPPGGASPSDHRPVVADLVVAPQAAWNQR